MFGLSCGKTEPDPVLAPNAGIGLYKEGKKEEAMEAWAKIADRNAMGSGMAYTAALLADGMVKGVGSNEIGRLNFEDWTDIAAIDARYRHTVGLRSDGTLIVTKDTTNNPNYYDAGVTSAEELTDVIAFEVP